MGRRILLKKSIYPKYIKKVYNVAKVLFKSTN